MQNQQKQKADEGKNFSGNEKRAVPQNPLCHIQSNQPEQTISTHKKLSAAEDPEGKCYLYWIFHRTKSIHAVKKKQNKTKEN